MSAKTQSDLSGLFDDLPMTEAEVKAAGEPDLPPRVHRNHRALFLLLIVWKWPFGIGVVAFLIGSFFGTTNPLVFTIAAEAPELGSRVMGASVGIISSVSSIAGFLVPTLAGAYLGSLATADEHHYQVVLTIAAVCVWMVLICALLLRETGRRSQNALAIEAPIHPLIPTAEP